VSTEHRQSRIGAGKALTLAAKLLCPASVKICWAYCANWVASFWSFGAAKRNEEEVDEPQGKGLGPWGADDEESAHTIVIAGHVERKTALSHDEHVVGRVHGVNSNTEE
jgi:hypothetical protein